MNSLIQGLKIWAEHISLFLFKEKKLILLKDPKTWICIFTQSSQRCFRWVLFHPFMLGDQVSGSSLQSGRAQVQTWVSQSLTMVLCMIIYTGWTTDWFQIGKGVCQGCILSPCLFNFYVEYIMRNTGLKEAQSGIKIAGRNINNPRSHVLKIEIMII